MEEPRDVREVFRGHLLSVAIETWPGQQRERVSHPGAAAVVAVTEDLEIVLVKQLRESVREELVEIPAGLLDLDGEEPIDCARRELFEETGYRAGEIRPLARVFTSPGFSNEVVHLFVARAERERDGGEEDGVTAFAVPLDEAVAMVEDGRIVDAKSCIGILLVSRHPGMLGEPEAEGPRT